MEETNVENAEEIQSIETHFEMLLDPEEQERIGASIVGPGGQVRDISFRVFRLLTGYLKLKTRLQKYGARKNQIKITVTFDVGDVADKELLLESVEAACGDMLYHKDLEDQRSNWGDMVRFNNVCINTDEDR